jgi:DnaK suppressor protein
MARKDASLRLAARLMARRDALRRALDVDLDGLREVPEQDGVGDRVDSAEEEIHSQLVELESRELGQIDQALGRIAAGTYGRCESCGRRIPAARLNAIPQTNSCIGCQRAKERRRPSGASDPDPGYWAKADERPIDEGLSDASIDLGDFDAAFRRSGRRALGHLLV